MSKNTRRKFIKDFSIISSGIMAGSAVYGHERNYFGLAESTNTAYVLDSLRDVLPAEAAAVQRLWRALGEDLLRHQPPRHVAGGIALLRLVRENCDDPPARARNMLRRREQLDQMGFVWCVGSWKWETFVLALRTYQDLYGAEPPASVLHPHLVVGVPVTFVVPARGSKAARHWPPRTHGLALGKKARAVARHGVGVMGVGLSRGGPPAEARVAELDALGFVWDAHETAWATVHAALGRRRREAAAEAARADRRAGRSDA